MEDINKVQKDSFFETAPIGKLMAKFAIPAVVSMVVNSIYHIVDQIFVGQGIGYLGNTAMNIGFPVITFSFMIFLLIADGCVAYFSIKLGEREHAAAEKTLGNAITLALIGSTAYLIFGELFLEDILVIAGGIPGSQSYDYAVEYMRIILLGVPIVAVSMSLSNIIRADGNPRYSMLMMLVGCITNIVLDYLFVMVYGWGMAGAAWATIIGQVLNFSLAIFYLPRFKTVKFRAANLKLDMHLVKKVLPLGISSSVVQLASTIIVIVMNNLMVKYGLMSKYGPDIPMAAFGIAMKVNQIIMSVMIGLSVGSQPIIGFNYGAKNFTRVKATYLRCITVASVVAVIGCIIFQLFPQSIVNLFGQESDLYNEFAVKCFKIFLSTVCFLGIILPTGVFFQSIGKPTKAMAASLSRQIIFFLPASIILSKLFGLEGLLYTGPVADSCALIFVIILVAGEIKHLNKLIREGAERTL